MKSSLFSLLLLAVVAGAGCRSTQMNTVDPAQPANQREMISDKRVLKDQSLNKAVNIVGLNVGTGPEGFLKVQVEVENRTRSLKSFTYTVEWFDENGILIELP
ncbi:MAG: hypothetical protein KDM81_02815, partial [Verrucomicrobiae bacterium]|nr:hypothetical protein [Verrucomicrobiae bacterium]